MQHDHVLKKLNFDLLTPSSWWGRGEVCRQNIGGGVSRGMGGGQNICYHVAAFLILFPSVVGEGVCLWAKYLLPCGMLLHS